MPTDQILGRRILKSRIDEQIPLSDPPKFRQCLAISWFEVEPAERRNSIGTCIGEGKPRGGIAPLEINVGVANTSGIE